MTRQQVEREQELPLGDERPARTRSALREG